jgi:hypothetical protein
MQLRLKVHVEHCTLNLMSGQRWNPACVICDVLIQHMVKCSQQMACDSPSDAQTQYVVNVSQSIEVAVCMFALSLTYKCASSF